MSQSSDFETTNFVAASLFTPDPLTPAPSTPEPSTPAEARATRRDEDRLFRHFRGYTWSQRSRNTKSWVWEYGFDIEKDSERRWVCRLCIERNRPKPGNVVAIGTQNAERHLWDHGSAGGIKVLLVGSQAGQLSAGREFTRLSLKVRPLKGRTFCFLSSNDTVL
ncbi:hypothetical protein FOVG_18212 [Fusarium oxysporum f. sp. pisi HDV247]|uniref:BED-type domain-containing protein n=1 Tax=Fusarium oxysporum f. sp. pisi HDV247 TaxID=1080344 RepID=W9NI59_FUSOX|nr:hypothetical protein FOVG_18212 [Fusarium oxysporum f. sp. pisi HDV247]